MASRKASKCKPIISVKLHSIDFLNKEMVVSAILLLVFFVTIQSAFSNIIIKSRHSI